MEVIESMSCEDGIATARSDASIDCILINWSQGENDLKVHTEATELMRSVRGRNARLPIFLMANRKIGGTVSVEVAQLADEFIWIPEDTAPFIAGRVSAAVDRYREQLLPPYAKALATYNRDNEYSWAAPGHQGGVAFLKSPVGRVFFDFFGENLFRTDMGIERGALGSLLGHSGPVGESERYAARVFGAHRSYTVLNGTSASNRTIMTACVGDGEIALCDRNCHKSIEQGLALTGGIPVFITPTRNRYGIIGPASPASLEPPAIEKAIAANPLAKDAKSKRAVYSVLTNCTYDGMCYDSAQVEQRLAQSVDRIHLDEAWYGYARFNPLYRKRFAMRDEPSSHPKDGPTVFATHSTHKLLAALSQTSWIHIRDGKGAIDHGRFNEAYCTQASTSPLYLLIASNDVAAAMMDGPGGHALTQETIDEAVACRLATARVHQEFKAKKDWFFAPWNAPEIKDAKSGKKVPFHEASAEQLATDPECWVLHPGEKWHGFDGIPDGWCMLDPDQVRHRLPRHAGRRRAGRARHPGRHRHRVYRAARHRPLAHHRPHGAVPVLDGHHQGQVGHAAQHAAGLQGRLRPQRLAGRSAAQHRRRGRRALRRHGPEGSRRPDVAAPAHQPAGPLAGAGLRHAAQAGDGAAPRVPEAHGR